MVGTEGRNLEICHSRLPEYAFASTRTAIISLKNLSTTTESFYKSNDVVLKLHET